MIGIVAATHSFIREPLADSIGHPIEDRQQFIIGGTAQLQQRQLSGGFVGDEHAIGDDQMIM